MMLLSHMDTLASPKPGIQPFADEPPPDRTAGAASPALRPSTLIFTSGFNTGSMEPSHAVRDSWTEVLRANPLPWLLDDTTPAVRHLALRQLLDRPAGAPEVTASLRAAMRTHPIAEILAHQQPEGYWAKPGAGYSPKYISTVWQVIFLDQLGADPADRRVARACAYVLDHTQAKNGGFGASGVKDDAVMPPPSRAIHCLTGNLLRALLGFGWLEDERVRRAITWQAQIATGEDNPRYYASGASGPGFACAANDGLPCAWGATKVMLAFARIPPARRTPGVERAIQRGVQLVLNVDPATAAYPMGYGNTRPNGSWFKLGFPSGYVADVLQVMEALCELGYGGDPRLQHSVAWLLNKQDASGRWKNENAYTGKLWSDIDAQGQPSKWVTLRACRVLKLVQAQGGLPLTTPWFRTS
jgi:hypothetical protein